MVNNLRQCFMLWRLIVYASILIVMGNEGAEGGIRPSSAIIFETTSVSFGHTTAGKEIIKEFHFTNSGSDTLQITTVLASDGGTIAYWPLQPLPPGAKDVIKVKFGFTTSRSGYQDKQFTVLSNAGNNPVILHLKGYVEKGL